MIVTQEQLDVFYRTASDSISQGEIQTREDLFALWSLLNPESVEKMAIADSIRKGDEDVLAGRGRPARDVLEEILQQYGLPRH